MRNLARLATLVALVACGQSAPTAPGLPGAPGAPGLPAAGATGAPAPGAPGTPAAPVVPGMPAMPGVPQNPFQALGQMAQAMQNAQAPNAGNVVHWRQLAEALPAAAPGWTPEGDVEGSTGAAMGLAVSEVRRSFAQGDRRWSVKITDSSINQMAAMAFNAARTVQVDSSQEVQRPVDVQGQPGFMKYQHQSRDGEVTLLVAGRFICEVRVTLSPSPDEVTQMAGLVNVGRLAQLAAAPPAAPAPAPAP